MLPTRKAPEVAATAAAAAAAAEDARAEWRREQSAAELVVGCELAALGVIGLCNADRVRELHQGPLAQAGFHGGLGHMPAKICSRLVNFRWVLTRQGTAAVRAPTYVYVDNVFLDNALLPSQASDALRLAGF